jgi:alkylation response protein AidB-like acyl-CoA dehydrogenase
MTTPPPHHQLAPAARPVPVPVPAPAPGQGLGSASFDAIAVADELARTFATTAIERDKLGGTAKAERDRLRESGLLALSVPTSLGGHGGSWTLVMEVVRRLGRVDGSLAHLFGFHHLLLGTARLFGPEAQWAPWLRSTVERTWFWGNALNPLDTRTTIVARGGLTHPQTHLIDGQKSFCSGASDSDRLVVSALDPDKRLVVAVIPTSRPGIHILDDWDNMGQRQTDSGQVRFEQVVVDESEILRQPGPLGSVFASLRPCIAQLVLTNVYLGLGEGALDEGVRWTRGSGRPWVTAGVERPSDDPYVLHHAGEFWVALAGARALADGAARQLDDAWARGDALTTAERAATALAIGTAKVAATRAGLAVANGIFEITGARATAARAGLDRFWRNLRTHTLHDPVDYRLRELGRWVLTGELPHPSFYS